LDPCFGDSYAVRQHAQRARGVSTERHDGAAAEAQQAVERRLGLADENRHFDFNF
jgi:hypothetical protein